MNPLPPYQYGAARTMVHLHGQYLADFVAVWRQAKQANLPLPTTDDPNYVSLEMLLRHALSAAGGYMIWMCKQLELPNPEIKPVPALAVIAQEADGYVTHLIDRWAKPLAEVEEERFGSEHTSNWGATYSIDAMLEHAVMHTILHRVQLEELLAEQ